jgi:hypothetical protein
MMVEPRAALDRLTAALESHLSAAASGRGEDDPAYESAVQTLVDAFEVYDEALYEAYGIDTPFTLYEDDEDETFDDDEDDEEVDEEEL